MSEEERIKLLSKCMDIDCICQDCMYLEFVKNNILKPIQQENKALNQKYLNAVSDYEQEKFNVEQLKKQLEEYKHHLKCAKEMLEVQGQDGNYNYDSYMLGLYNGMEYIISLFETREPIYIDSKDIEFLNDKNQQKEFIDYINLYIELLSNKPDLIEESNKDLLEEILSKYREIIGVKMNKDIYDEIINGIDTYKKIAETLINKGSCIIGWTDEKCDHRDILFTYKPKHLGGKLQRGLKWCYLYISIMNCSCMGFLIENDSDNRKHSDYIMEKLRLNDNHCDLKICELINGVIYELDMLRGDR